jgi:hypothetical protein
MSTTTSHLPDGSIATVGRERSRGMPLRVEGTSVQARRAAAAVLEVLAGLRTPAQAARELSLSLPTYYKLESRALSGLVQGCDKPLWARRSSADQQLASLQKHCRRLEQDLHRYQALARVAQKAAGLSPAERPQKLDSKGRRQRRPSVRAVKAVRSLRRAEAAELGTAPSTGSPVQEGGA